jgi:FkbH-like protein
MRTVDDIRAELTGYKYSDYLKNLPAVEKACAGAQAMRVAVLRSYTVEAIEPVLALRLGLEGFRTEFFFGGYDQYVQEILNGASELYKFDPHVVLLLVRVEDLMPDFVRAFGKPGSEWEAYVESKASELGALARTLRQNSAAQLLVQNLSLAGNVYWGIYDAQDPSGQSRLVERFNQRLAEALRETTGSFVWDFNRFVQRRGYEQIFDAKMWYLSKNPYKQSVYPHLVDDLFPYLLSILGRAKKCIVLDLDNTLWGGIVGEDGLEGIQLGHSYPGNCYREFQQGLLKLYQRGVILAINSKNNEADALRVLDEHPDMLLRREHFAAMQINWDDKANNLRMLAATLNIGLDSMVMIDDSPAECALIRGSVPAVEVVCLPEQPYLIPQILDRLPGVENIRLTQEDRKKGAMYQAQAARQREEAAFGSVEEFLASLKLEVHIESAAAFSIPRIAQLTQKTNQLNVTTRRYSEADIELLTRDPRTDVFSVSVRDKFGDNGIVGVLIAKHEGDECRIDTLLLSCRVIGRNIEASMIASLADVARRRGAKALIGEFFPTAKNAPAADLYARLGFERLAESRYRLDVSKRQLTSPAYIRATVSGGG